jgi:hypothetical protein
LIVSSTSLITCSCRTPTARLHSIFKTIPSTTSKRLWACRAYARYRLYLSCTCFPGGEGFGIIGGRKLGLVALDAPSFSLLALQRQSNTDLRSQAMEYGTVWHGIDKHNSGIAERHS